ncbi:hypothetical protein L6452_44159 [Arctium lappa]|uniref:Uncharacterized protein n=1 Tax=Arctium lappa TaxID=4217 RepID=A0ACB8XFQ3_ARCLA|nr:hypothetical protein L6452_44159 [Arctium lappa]
MAVAVVMICCGPRRRSWTAATAMMGMRRKVRMWLTRYWYPSFTYLSLMEDEKSGKICGIFGGFLGEKNWGITMVDEGKKKRDGREI